MRSMRLQKWISLLLSCILVLGLMPVALATDGSPLSSGLLTEPFLQVPGKTSVNVVWFTESEQAPDINKVLLYENGADEPATREIVAVTTKLSRVRGGKTSADCNNASITRNIWRHEAVVTDLPEYHGSEDEKVSYNVVSDDAESKIYTLQAQAQEGTPQKILLTSDIQTKNMCAANIQKVTEAVGPIDAVLADGDIVDVADRAYDWFDADSSFFRVMQGTTDRVIGGNTYTGAELLQNAPVYAAIGNHEVMGRYSDTSALNAQFNDSTTRAYAEELYERVNSDADPDNNVSAENKEQFIRDNSFNTTSWEEVFTLPESETGDERYYAVTIGDVRVIVLEVARIWRGNAVGGKGKYSEVPGASVDEYGFGQHIFEPIDAGSDQLAFLEDELQSDSFRNAKYKMVMYHWQFHSLGGNQIPAYTDPVAGTVTDPVTNMEMTIYDYPLAEDYLANYVEPLLDEYDVDMVFNAHSHLWNRFQTDSGMNILETSNNGNTYNAFLDTKSRTDAWPSVFNSGNARASIANEWDAHNYILQGDPYGLSPIAPNLAPLPNATADEPYLMSNTVTAFSVLDTGTGTVDSYYFDTSNPDSAVVHFDSFAIQKDGGTDLDENDVLSRLGSYATGYSDQDGGVAEIVSYNADNEKFYLVNGREKKLDIVSMSNLSASGENQSLTLEKRVDVSAMIPGFTFGDITSVAVDTWNDRIAVAVQAEAYDAPGAILLLNYDGGYIAHYTAGVQPDMVTFSPDGKYVLSADEGEPRQGYGVGAVDPKGSVTIVDLSAEEPVPNTVTFDSWDSKRGALIDANVLLKSGLAPSTDFEPEYIAVSSDGTTAYVALQEANAIATLNLASGTFTAIDSLGFKDHRLGGNELDAVKDNSVNLKWENRMGVYMPDGISLYEVNGKTYLLTANEGDASEWGADGNEYTNMTTVELSGEEVLDKTKVEGLPTVPSAVNFILGGRSFSIYEVTENGLSQVFDSGSDFEKVTAAAYPEYFNASNKNNKLDSRSDAKGPEPESVTVAKKVGGKSYAYVGLERIGGVMLYDITDPAAPRFCDYINSRDFTVNFPKEGTDPAQGDVSVEGICAVAAANSPTGYPLLLAANEVSGTVTVYQQNEGFVNPNPGSDGDGGSSSTLSVTVPVTSDKGSVSVSATVSSGTAIVTATNTQVEKIISYAETTGTVTIDVSGLKNVDSAKIPAKLLAAADGATGSDGLEVVLPSGTVKLDDTVLASVAAANKDITVSVEEVKTSALTTAQKEALGDKADSAVVVDINVLVNGIKTSSFNGGTLTVSIPYTPKTGEDTSKLTVWYIKDDGTIENKGGYYDSKNTCFVFDTTHLSQYVLVSDTSVVSPFTDVSSNAYYYDAVLWAIENGVTSGATATSFAPNASCTRAQTATFLWRTMGSPEPASTTNPFTDVSPDAYYYKAVLWALEKGITAGTSATTFAPNAIVTRSQTVTFLWRAAGKPATTETNPFTDMNSSDYFAGAVAWAVDKGITDGTSATTFSPNADCIRGQIVTFLYRYLGE